MINSSFRPCFFVVTQDSQFMWVVLETGFNKEELVVNNKRNFSECQFELNSILPIAKWCPETPHVNLLCSYHCR